MKSADWKRFVRPTVGPNWEFSKTLAYRRPVGWVVRGVLAERSGAGGFYLWNVRLPLYWPTEVVALSWSERVGGGTKRWDADSVALEVLRGLVAEIDASAQNESVVVTPPGGVENVLMQEARGYGLVVESAFEEAMRVLGPVTDYAPTYDWERAMVARASNMLAALADGQHEMAMETVRDWRVASARALGIVLDD